MKTITIANQKGGVGKTVTALNLGQGLSKKGKKTLLIDLDPQATLTSIFIKETIEESLYDFLNGKGKPGNYIHHIENNLSLFPSDNRLTKIERGGEGDFTILKKATFRLRDYDLIIIDAPPSLGILTSNALMSSDYVLIPIKTDYLSLSGVINILNLIFAIQEKHNNSLEILGYLPCQYDSRRVLDREVLELLKKRFSNVLPPIRQNIDLGVSPSWGQTIFDFNPKSKGAEDYKKLTNFVYKKLK